MDSVINSGVFLIWVAVLGVAIGSFVMAIADRGELPRGRSYCDACKKSLDSAALIPVIGWLIRRGRCQRCQARVSARYPIGELVFGLVVAVTFIHLRNLAEGSVGLLAGLSVIWLALISTSWVMSTIDWRSMILPNRGNWLLFVLSLSHWALVVGVDIEPWYQGVLGGGLLFAIFYGTFQLSGGRWIGGGDVKLAPSMGVLLGPTGGLIAVALASYIALGYVGARYINSRGKLQIKGLKMPFGPFLLLGTWAAYLFWQGIIDALQLAG